jgi:hypothetical protein
MLLLVMFVALAAVGAAAVQHPIAAASHAAAAVPLSLLVCCCHEGCMCGYCDAWGTEATLGAMEGRQPLCVVCSTKGSDKKGRLIQGRKKDVMLREHKLHWVP